MWLELGELMAAPLSLRFPLGDIRCRFWAENLDLANHFCVPPSDGRKS
jgi:hypothetical protein